MLRLLLSALTIACLFTACQPSDSSTTEKVETGLAPAAAPAPSPKELDPAALSILNRALKAHGSQRLSKVNFGFTFRGSQFEFITENEKEIYKSSYEKEGKAYNDRIEGGIFHRLIDNASQTLNEKEAYSGFETLNSVIYFATLPHKLRDPAVNLYAAGTATIKGKAYDMLRVNFDEEGGGVDHDDNFLYWINQETNRIDYLAYDYKTNKGGVRFRSAFNPRVVAGVLFQDYVNYKAPLGTPLADLPGLFEKGELEELSIIATEGVMQLD